MPAPAKCTPAASMPPTICGSAGRSGTTPRTNWKRPDFPERNPFRSGKLFHKEKARNTGMGVAELPGWWAELQALPNPIRRELHLFMLLTGLRRTEVLFSHWANFGATPPLAAAASPKGEERAFELPLSSAMLACLDRVKEAGQTYYPEESKTWIFPAPGGHVAEVKEEGRQKLSHTGHAQRPHVEHCCGCRRRPFAA